MTQAQFNTDFIKLTPGWKSMQVYMRKQYYHFLKETYYKDGNITKQQFNKWRLPKFLFQYLRLIGKLTQEQTFS